MPRRPNVVISNLPEDSGLKPRIQRGDFLDCYAVDSDMPTRRAAEIVAEFPAWARVLVRIRRLVTEPFGLINDVPSKRDKVGPFPVESETDGELIAGFNDKHLDFRVSICARDGKVSLATWVHTHNIAGRIYLALIMPFHVMISRDALARVGRQDAKATT